MAERVITVSLNLDATGVETGAQVVEESLLTINQQLVQMEDELRNLSKETSQEVAQASFDKLNNSIEKNVLSIQDLGVAADNYKNIAIAAGVTTPLGQEALRMAAEMERQMDGINQQVAQLAEGGRNLNAALQLGTAVTAGYAAYQGVAALAGVENEKLQETFVKLQAAQAVLSGTKELSIALSRKGILASTAETISTTGLAAATAAYNVVVGSSTGLLKVLRIALISTGIGALVVGVGLLIANFDKVKVVVAEVVDWFGNLGEHVTRLIEWYNELGIVGKAMAYVLAAPIMLAIEAYQFFFGTVEKGAADMMKSDRLAAEARQAQHNEWGKQLTAELKGLKDKRKAEQEAHNERQGQFDLEIERLEALGQSSNDLKLQKLQDLQDELKAQIQFIVDSSKAYEAYYEKRRAESGQSREEFIASMKAQGIDLEKLQGQQNAIIQELENKVFSSESKILAFKRTVREQNRVDVVEDNKELIDEEGNRIDESKKLADKQADQLFNDRQKVAQDLEEWERQQRLDVFQIKMDDLRSQFEQEMELFKGNEQMKRRLTEQFNQQLADIQAEANASDDEAEQARFDEKIDGLNSALDKGAQALEKLSEINDVMNAFGDRRKERIQSDADQELSDLERSKQKQLNVEGLSAKRKAEIEYQSAMAEYNIKKQAAEQQDKIAKRQFDRNKAIALIEIGINTASAIVKGIAQFGPPPSPAGIAAIAVASGIGIAQGALVASRKFQGSASSISPPSFSMPSFDTGGGSGSGDDGSNNRNGQNDSTTLTDGLINPPPIIISQVEINKVQGQLALINDLSVL